MNERSSRFLVVIALVAVTPALKSCLVESYLSTQHVFSALASVTDQAGKPKLVQYA